MSVIFLITSKLWKDCAAKWRRAARYGNQPNISKKGFRLRNFDNAITLRCQSNAPPSPWPAVNWATAEFLAHVSGIHGLEPQLVIWTGQARFSWTDGFHPTRNIRLLMPSWSSFRASLPTADLLYFNRQKLGVSCVGPCAWDSALKNSMPLARIPAGSWDNELIIPANYLSTIQWYDAMIDSPMFRFQLEPSFRLFNFLFWIYCFALTYRYRNNECFENWKQYSER